MKTFTVVVFLVLDLIGRLGTPQLLLLALGTYYFAYVVRDYIRE